MRNRRFDLLVALKAYCINGQPLVLSITAANQCWRGHRFVRYSGDANIYVRSQRAGERVMVSVERFLDQRLKLSLNRGKSRVARPWICDYLGYGMSWRRQPKLRVTMHELASFARPTHNAPA